MRQYMEAILVNLALRDPLPFMQARLLPALRSYHHKLVLLHLLRLLPTHACATQLHVGAWKQQVFCMIVKPAACW